jgi:hypothetical protein
MKQDQYLKKLIQEKVDQLPFDKIESADKIWNRIEPKIQKKDKRRVFAIWFVIIFGLSSSLLSYKIIKDNIFTKSINKSDKTLNVTNDYASYSDRKRIYQEPNFQSIIDNKNGNGFLNREEKSPIKNDYTFSNEKSNSNKNAEIGISKTKFTLPHGQEIINDNFNFLQNEDNLSGIQINLQKNIEEIREIKEIAKIQHHFSQLKFNHNEDILSNSKKFSQKNRFELLASFGLGYTTLFQNPNTYDHLFISNYEGAQRKSFDRIVVQSDLQVNYNLGKSFFVSSILGLQYAQWKFSYDQNTVDYQKTQISDTETIFQRNVSKNRINREDKFLNFHVGLGLSKKIGKFEIVCHAGIEKNLLTNYHDLGSFLETKVTYKLNDRQNIGAFLHNKMDNTQYSSFVLNSSPLQYGVVWQYQFQ